MKIVVCGKGGSGKSTVTSLLAKEIASRGGKVLVIDADESNYGLHQQLGMELPKTFIDYFGGKMKVLQMLSNGPQNMPALFDRPWNLSDIPKEYVTEKDGIMLMSPGKIETANEACACPFNAIMCQFVPALALNKNEFVIMDMEAGIEHFGRGTDNVADAVVMVIDPSYESLKLSSKVTEIAKGIGKPVYYVLNKVTDESLPVMESKIPDASKIACVLKNDGDILSAGLIGEPLSAGRPEIGKLASVLGA